MPHVNDGYVKAKMETLQAFRKAETTVMQSPGFRNGLQKLGLKTTGADAKKKKACSSNGK